MIATQASTQAATKRSSSTPAKPLAEHRLLQAEADQRGADHLAEGLRVGERRAALGRVAPQAADRELDPAADDRRAKRSASSGTRPPSRITTWISWRSRASSASPQRATRVSSARRSPSGSSASRGLKASISAIRSDSAASNSSSLLGKCL